MEQDRRQIKNTDNTQTKHHSEKQTKERKTQRHNTSLI